MKRLKKRYFQLLEVMIAMAVVSMCAIPLIYPHMFMTHQQQLLKRELGYDHVANLIYADLIEQLYKNKIAWDDIESGKRLEVSPEHFSKAKLPGSGFAQMTVEKRKAKGKNCLLKILVHVHPPGDKPIEYQFRVFVQRAQGDVASSANDAEAAKKDEKDVKDKKDKKNPKKEENDENS